MHARINGGKATLLTRTGLSLPAHNRCAAIPKVKPAYIDGELCALNAEGAPVFNRLQAAMDEGKTDRLVFFAFDLLFLNGQSTAALPLIQRKERLQRLFKKEIDGLRYSERVAGNGPQFRAQACKYLAWMRSGLAVTMRWLPNTSGACSTSISSNGMDCSGF